MSVANSLTESEKSVVFLLPENVPWHSEMHGKLETLLSKPDRKFEIIAPAQDIEPGTFILDRYFKSEVRDRYRPTVGHTKFIASNDETSPFRDSFIIVMVKSKAQLSNWVDFIKGYEKEKRAYGSHGCLFILEYLQKSGEKHHSTMNTVKWDDFIHDYDKHMFALLSVSQIKENREILEYLSEFISLLCHDDVELAAELAAHGMECVFAPEKAIADINENALRNNGDTYNIAIDSRQISSILWEAQIKILFPKIEKFKSDLIVACEQFFNDGFTYTTPYGREKIDYHELEIGEILFLYSEGRVNLPEELVKKAKFYKECRNSLAHSTPISFDDVKKILK